MWSSWYNNWVTWQHARCNNGNKKKNRHGIFTEVEHRLKLMYHIAFEVLVNNLVSTLLRSCYGVWLPFGCSWSVRKMLLSKLVTPKVFMWYFAGTLSQPQLLDGASILPWHWTRIWIMWVVYFLRIIHTFISRQMEKKMQSPISDFHSKIKVCND